MFICIESMVKCVSGSIQVTNVPESFPAIPPTLLTKNGQRHAKREAGWLM